jgi:hypothetical protein
MKLNEDNEHKKHIKRCFKMSIISIPILFLFVYFYDYSIEYTKKIILLGKTKICSKDKNIGQLPLPRDDFISYFEKNN